MKGILFVSIYFLLGFSLNAQNLDLNNSTDYVRIQKNGETGFSRAFGLNGSNHLYIGSVEKTIGNIYFFNKGTNYLMTLTPNGNLGLGTTTPDQALVVNGNIGFDYGDNRSHNGFRRNGIKTEYYNVITGTNSNVIHEFTGTNKTIMSLTQGGNVGIGTTTPDQALVVNGKIGFDYGDNKSHNGFRRNGIKTEYYNVITGTNSNVIHEFTGTNKTIMSLTQGGNVGIGTTTPDQALVVNGKIGFDYGDNKSHNGFRRNGIKTEYYNVITGTNSNVIHEFTGTNRTIMSLTQGGNVGIGTTSPDAKLAVKGKIHTQEVKVDLNGAVAPDYVFLEDYNLKTIDEVENYIEKEGHLPNIPSAKDMEQNGIELKTMNLKLLEKIEELTLYMIKQNKKTEILIKTTESQQKEIKSLQNEIAQLKINR